MSFWFEITIFHASPSVLYESAIRDNASGAGIARKTLAKRARQIKPAKFPSWPNDLATTDYADDTNPAADILPAISVYKYFTNYIKYDPRQGLTSSVWPYLASASIRDLYRREQPAQAAEPVAGSTHVKSILLRCCT